jgi:hypothetical protein
VKLHVLTWAHIVIEVLTEGKRPRGGPGHRCDDIRPSRYVSLIPVLCNDVISTPDEISLRSRVMEKLLVTHLVKKFPAFYGTQRFITVFTRSSH